jgi:hypothetical protein
MLLLYDISENTFNTGNLNDAALVYNLLHKIHEINISDIHKIFKKFTF